MRQVASFLAICLGTAVFGIKAEAAVPAYRPANPNTVLLRLGHADAQLQRLRNAARTTEGLVAYVQALIASGQRTGDERYYGYAEQALRGREANLGSDVQLLRARLLQHRHDFAAAERTLTPLIERDPRDRAARLMRAQVRLHLKQSALAMQDCVALVPLVDALTATTCIAQARAALGDLRHSYSLVAAAFARDVGDTTTRSWSAGVAAELAVRMGDTATATADRWFQSAVALDPESHFARVSYADWLLWSGQRDRALTIALQGTSLADRTRVVLAKGSAQSSEARELQLFWTEATARGERGHLRDLARFHWLVRCDATTAHRIALDNFRDHQDGEDALLLASTAAATRDEPTLARLRAWQIETHYQDVRLQHVLESGR